jgi:ribA/ribD-fused uncharacterized protein
MKDTIAFTKVALPFGWLGNMSPYPITWDNREWRTTEALFQALRFSDKSIQEKIREQKSPMAAKMVAKPFSCKRIIEVGSQQDIENMRLCLKLKLEQHPKLQEELCKTRDKLIVEDVSSRGARGTNLLWGAQLKDGEWVGKNVLGNLWMELREEVLIK